MSQPSEYLQPAITTVAIVGVGLIGGSIAAALKDRQPAVRVLGVGRDARRLEVARSRGLLDEAFVDLTAAAHMADVVVFCTPVDRIVAGVREAATACRPGALLTDAGSVKRRICDAFQEAPGTGVEFVGAHPLAGSEKQGFEAADAALFENRVCVVTPTPQTTARAAQRVAAFWAALGARVLEMSPAAHDLALAQTSHLPHLTAAVLAATLAAENRGLAASGFRDATRIAAGDPNLWTAILLQNADDVLLSLARYDQVLDQFRAALLDRDAAALNQLLQTAKSNRDAL